MRFWDVVLDDGPHRIVIAKDHWLLDRPRSLMVDDRLVPLKVGVAVAWRRHVEVPFTIGQQRAELRMSVPSIVSGLKRAIPGAVVGAMAAPTESAFERGLEAGEGAARNPVGWQYELMIDGTSYGPPTETNDQADCR